jgi:hypothetical protein
MNSAAMTPTVRPRALPCRSTRTGQAVAVKPTSRQQPRTGALAAMPWSARPYDNRAGKISLRVPNSRYIPDVLMMVSPGISIAPIAPGVSHA